MNTVTRHGIEVDLSYEHKTSCPWCITKGRDRSGDNLHVYGLDEDSEHLGAKCFSCGAVIPSVKWLRDNKETTLEDMEYELVSTEFNDEVHEGIKSITSFNSKNYRGITTQTSKYFGVRYECSQESGEVVASYYPTTKGVLEGVPISQAISGYKVRKHPKDFSSPVGEVGSECDLFMQFRFPTHKGYLLIAAGEIDALSAYQILKKEHDKKTNNRYDETAVISGLTGEGGSANHIRKHYEWVDQFQRIIICFDADKAGELATKALAEVLPRGKVFTMKVRHNDINTYIEKGDEASFVNDFWGMRPYTPDGVKSSFDGFMDLKEELLVERITLPPYMKTLQERMGGGFARSAIHNVIAATGVSKTTHMRNIVYHMIMNSGLKPVILSLEETAAKYNLELLQLHAKENFTFGKTGQEIIDYLETPRMQKLQKELMVDENGAPRYWIIDERSGDIKSLETQMEVLHKKHGSSIFIQDVLSDVLRGSSAELAEDHMAFQRRMAKNGVTFLNTHHTRKPSTNKDGKENKTSEYDVLGTGSFVQSGHTNIVLNRDKLECNDVLRNTTEVDLPKCRGGITGAVGGWFWDFHTLQCYDVEDYKKENPHLFMGE